MQQPPLGWTTTVELDKVQDADTVTVSIKKQLVIRLVDDEIYFDAPEIYHPKSEEEKQAGLAATAFLKSLLYNKDGSLKQLVIHIPADERGRMRDVTHLSRFEGQLWADGVDVVDELIKAGFVKREK